MPVHINAEISFDGTLRLRLRRYHKSCDLIRLHRDRVKIRSGTSHVEHHEIPYAVIKNLCRLHNRSRSRNYRPAYHVANVLHARSLCYMLLKSLLYNLSAWLDIKLIYLRIHVFNYIKLLTAPLIEDQPHLLLIFDVPGINDRRPDVHGAYHLGIVESRFTLAVIYTPRDQNQVRLYLPYLCDIRPAKAPRGHIMDYSSRTECGFLGGLCGHIVNESVYGHLETACRRRSRQHLVIFYFICPLIFAEVIDSTLKSHANVALQH